MVKYQKNKNSMYSTVHAFVTDNISIYSGTDGMVACVRKLEEVIEAIRFKEDESHTIAKGKTIDKNVTRNSVNSLAKTIAGALYAYGKETKNIVLQEKTKITGGYLKTLRNLDLVRVLESIKELAAEKRSEIIPFGATPEKISEFELRLEKYSKALMAKESSGAARSSAKKSVRQLFKDGDDIIDTLDKLMENYSESNPAFYNGYKSARVIRNLGIRHDQQLSQEPGSDIGLTRSENVPEEIKAK